MKGNFFKTLALSLFFGAASGHASTASSSYYEEAENNREKRFRIDAFGSEIFGDNLNVSSGTVEFVHTDVSLKGNFDIDVAFTRTYVGNRLHNDAPISLRELQDWMIDIPHVRTVRPQHPDVYSPWREGRQCSGIQRPGHAESHYFIPPNNITRYFTVVHADSYWTGLTMRTGSFDQGLLRNVTDGALHSAVNASSSNTYDYVTQANWKIDCFNLPNGAGEGFKATNPEGITYTFSQPSVYHGFVPNELQRLGVLTWFHEALYVSRIEDRFGNSVTFNYENYQLKSIVASDNRRIDIFYRQGSHISVDQGLGAVQCVVANMPEPGSGTRQNPCEQSSDSDLRIWKYSYSGQSLQNVTLPDNRRWVLDFAAWNADRLMETAGVNCAANLDPITVSVQHPDGYKADFNLAWTKHGMTSVPTEGDASRFDYDNFYDNGARYALVNGVCSATFALNSKTVKTEANQNLYTWNIDYTPQFAANFSRPDNIAYNDLQHYRGVNISNPDGSQKLYFVNRQYNSFLNGKIVAERTLDASNTRIQQTERTYAQGPLVGRTGNWVGSLTSREHRVNLTKEVIKTYHTDAGQSKPTLYTSEFSGHDIYGLYSNRHSYRTYDGVKSDEIYQSFTYHNEPKVWVIGAHKTTAVFDPNAHSKTAPTQASDYTLTRETTYHTTGAHKEQAQVRLVKQFGRWIKDYKEYHSDGNPKKVEYNAVRYSGAGNRYEQLLSYKRGIPQTITVPARETSGTMSLQRIVDDNGWITSETDFNGTTTLYDYDKVGRLIATDYSNDTKGDANPDNDDSWADRVYSWTNTAGSPVRTMRRCTYDRAAKACADTSLYTETETYDGLMRLKRLQQSDASNTYYQNFRFDSNHKPTFTSFVSNSANETFGVTTVYDGLRRMTQVTTTGQGTVNWEYQSNNKIKITNARNEDTITTYLAYGVPSYEQATNIASPTAVNVTTVIDIDVFGLTQSITQSGKRKNNTAVSKTESFYYDTYRQLCLSVRDDVGTTAYGKNALGETIWLAQGVTLPANSTACLAKPADAVDYTLDNFGDPKQVFYPAVADDPQTSTINESAAALTVSFARDNNGNLLSLQAGDVSHLYRYNNQNLPEYEMLSVPGKP